MCGKLYKSPEFLKSGGNDSGNFGNGFRMPTDDDLRYSGDNSTNAIMPTTLEEKRAYLFKLVVDSKGYNVDDKYGVLIDSGSVIFTFPELYKMIEDAKGTDTFYIVEKADLIDDGGCLVDIVYKGYSRDKERYLDKKRRGF